ncbi:MAG: hypothetical protein ACK4P4_11010 [Allorhizobium sp.]
MTKPLLAWLTSDGPRWYYKRIWLHGLLMALALSALIWASCSALGMSRSEIFAENAAHEMAQSILLGFAAIIGGFAAVRCSGVSRYAALVTALISYIGFVRETPACRGDVVHFCMSSNTHGTLIAIGVILILIATLLVELRARGTVLNAIHPRVSWPLALVAVLIEGSQISDGLHLVVLEETLEIYAYVVLLLGAGWLSLAAPMPREVPVKVDRWREPDGGTPSTRKPDPLTGQSL